MVDETFAKLAQKQAKKKKISNTKAFGRNPGLASYSAAALIVELRSRGYKGVLTIEQQIKV